MKIITKVLAMFAIWCFVKVVLGSHARQKDGQKEIAQLKSEVLYLESELEWLSHCENWVAAQGYSLDEILGELGEEIG